MTAGREVDSSSEVRVGVVGATGAVGQVTATSLGSRVAQLSLKLNF